MWKRLWKAIKRTKSWLLVILAGFYEPLTGVRKNKEFNMSINPPTAMAHDADVQEYTLTHGCLLKIIADGHGFVIF